MERLPKTQDGTHADKVRRLLPLMPSEFSILDVINQDDTISQPAASAALRWAVKHGLLKIVRQIGWHEWREQGKRGAPPVLYSFIGFDSYTGKQGNGAVPKKRGRPPTALARAKKQALTPTLPSAMALPPQLNAAIAVIEETPHQCDATQVLENVQRSLATVTLLIAMQKLAPEQAMSLAGTLNQLGEQSKRR